MDPFLIGALGSLGSAAIGGIGSLISSGKANENAIYMQRIQNNFNKQQATTSWNRAVDMWNRQNIYNSPKEQMNRLLQANLNPNLMYGQGSVGNASSSPSPDTPRGVELPNSYRYDMALVVSSLPLLIVLTVMFLCSVKLLRLTN